MSDNNNRLTIKSWAADDRPREKLLLKGKRSLSDAELLALLIGSGNKHETAVDLCKRILQSSNNNLNELAKRSVADLMKFRGIGEAKAITIVAALELGSRREVSETLHRQQITCSRDCYMAMKSEIADLPHEEFWVLYLNRSNKILEKFPVGRGGITGTVADIRLIFKRALENLATSIVLVHNHPSGNMQPSQEDIRITKKTQEAAQLFDITLLDHLIITQSGYFSFADSGMIK
jgi:DNA repair protein RadC